MATTAAPGVRTVNPYLHGSFAPTAAEATVGEGFEVIGQVPRDLAGTFLRNGPNPRLPPRGEYHWFDGDGMVHGFTVADGQVSYRARWVATPGLASEVEAGGPRWTGLLEPTAGNPAGAPYKDTANTDLVVHRGEALALWYMSGQPQALDPHSLAGRGGRDWGQPGLRVSAHAKVCPRTGELVFFASSPTAPYLHVGVVDADGHLRLHQPVPLPGPRVPHDLAITERFVVVMDPPLVPHPKAVAAGRWGVRVDRDLPLRFGVVPRAGGAARWFDATPAYVYHVVNAWDDGDRVVVIGCRTADPLPAVDPADGRFAPMMANLRLTAALWRWELDLATGALREQQLDDANLEFPVVDHRVVGQPGPVGYAVTLGPTPTLTFTGVRKVGMDGRHLAAHDFGPGRFGSEVAVAPRVGAAPGVGAGDDTYVLSYVHDEGTGRSEVMIFEHDLTVRARVLLPVRVPLGFHGCWAPAS
ncbi:MAG: carotenoid oxygenase family protein [Kofleriaceae bacterium]|jgi:carotenoid cleavage dioxygenase-like enzyme|nr:carotenoid oxygenase family protein [Kofleriaceae bacterium]